MATDDTTVVHPGTTQPVSPYGGKPSSGLQFPPYHQPTPSVGSRNSYFPFITACSSQTPLS
jgi:hypothetical protein